MRSLIILKGLVKQKKLDWVKRENLTNFLVDIENLKKIFYRPDYKGGRDFLVRSYDDIVYKVFIQSLCSRMSTGCLVVVDADEESTTSIEELATIFGYSIFYHIEDTPFDYVKKNNRYNDNQYLPLQKTELLKQVVKFNDGLPETPLIDSYKDLEKYWEEELTPISLKPTDTILHISDLHSHYNLLVNEVPDFNNYNLTILLGDYIDGPEIGGSRKLIDWIVDYPERPDVIFIEGNHELRLRKYLGYIYFKSKNKKIISETLENDLSAEFMENTAKEFFDIGLIEATKILEALNTKLKEFIIYERSGTRFICTHAGLRWEEQLSPKFIGNVTYSSKNPNKIDSSFSEKYFGKLWSIHGHCKYPDQINFRKYKSIINLDTEDENKVNYCINNPNKKFEIYVLEENDYN